MMMKLKIGLRKQKTTVMVIFNTLSLKLFMSQVPLSNLKKLY